MKKSNIEKLEGLVTQIMEICKEEKEKGLTIAITKDLVSIWSDPNKPRNKQVDLFSNNRGKTWSDMR